MLSFNVLDDLKEARQVLDNYLSLPGTRSSIEEAISIMASSLKQRGKIITAGNGGRPEGICIPLAPGRTSHTP